MLPHDELLHYGVLGMRWGVRNDRFRQASESRAKKKIEKYNIKQATQANDAQFKVRVGQLKEAHRQGLIDRATYKYKHQQEVLRYTQKFDELHSRKANLGKTPRPTSPEYKQAYQKTYDRFNRTYNRPFTPDDRKRGGSAFKRIGGRLAMDVATRVISDSANKMVGPSAEAFGNSFAEYMVSHNKKVRYRHLPKNLQSYEILAPENWRPKKAV